MTKYHSDEPIIKEREDIFGRKKFAENIIHSLQGMDKDQSFVVGLYAPWGFGKTSTINLIKSLVEEDLKVKRDLVIININAWSLNGDIEKIIWQILNEINENINGEKIKTTLKDIGSNIRKISEAELPFSSEIGIDLNGGGRNETKIESGKVTKSVNFIGRLLESSSNIDKVRSKISKDIKSNNKRVVVFIDDIDRLENKQMIELFRSIGSITNYDSTTYILPFDYDFVCSSITDLLPTGHKGEDFIEKIIQLPIIIPIIPQETISRIFLDKLDSIFKDEGLIISDNDIERFKKIYNRLELEKYIQSPRDINRIINILKFVLPESKGEINIMDKVITEVIRVFNNDLFNKIKSNKDLLVGDQYDLFTGINKENLKKKFENIFGDEGNRVDLVKELFPRVESFYSDHSIISDDDLRKEQRIGSNIFFDAFFGYFDDEYGVSVSKIIELLQKSEKQEVGEFLKIINKNNFQAYLNLIKDNKEIIANKPSFIEVLIDLCGEIEDNSDNVLGLDNKERIIYTIEDILSDSQAKLQDHKNLLDYSFKSGKYYMIPRFIQQVLGPLYSEGSRDSLIFNDQELEEYKKYILETIELLIKENKLPLDDGYGSVMMYNYWADFGKKEDIAKHVNKQINTGDSAIDFMAQFLGRWTQGNGYHRGDLGERVYETISKIIDVDFFYNIIIKDSEYKDLKHIKQEDVVWMSNPLNRRVNKEINKAGNEKSKEFRKNIAKQFIYLHDNNLTDVIEGK